ncbi:NAD-dependent epimerase/dehydratase family protein [Luteolibacter marinus]|uniref:NAD-dependent epimerase/dehydratase family protein n=1 Tax=Luteolibacter marinus TaxID=2776705 RepID=UPI001865BEE0|nr:NAD(P)-dependent oxidoreductase [Luteolibacter marinus]
MRIFLTGGTGFIGSHFINQAHAAGHEIVALRRSLASLPRVSLGKDPHWIDSSLEQVACGDLDGCEVLVHLAAHSANVPYDLLEACIRENVLAPLALFRTAIEAGIRRFIVAGSCFEYGRSGERYEFIPVDAPLEPTASYPSSKAAASVAFHTLACEENLELLILRIFQVYGEGELESRFWPSLRRAALAGEDMAMSEGTQVRDFIRVEDVAAGFVKALDRGDLNGGQPVIENLGSGHPQTLADFARAEWNRFGATGRLLMGAQPMRRNEVMRFVPEIPRAR